MVHLGCVNPEGVGMVCTETSMVKAAKTGISLLILPLGSPRRPEVGEPSTVTVGLAAVAAGRAVDPV